MKLARATVRVRKDTRRGTRMRSGAGRPSDLDGIDGDTYLRTDKATGWVYQKGLLVSGEWDLREVTLEGQIPDPFSAGGWYSNYLDDDADGNKWGNLMTNGRGTASLQAFSGLDADPTLRQGFDGADNWARVTDPVKGAPYKATKSRVNWSDTDTAGTNAKRAHARFGTDGTNDYNKPLIPLRSPHVFAWSLMIPSALKTQYTGNNNECVIFQVHDNQQGTGLSPTITLALQGTTNTNYGKSSGSVGVTWANRTTAVFPAVDADVTQHNLAQQDDIAADVWHHYLIEARLGYQVSDSPFTKIWHAQDNGSWTQIVNDTNLNAFNCDANGRDLYAAHGLYSYRGTSNNTLDTDGTWTCYMKDCVISAPNTTLSADDLRDARRWLQVR